MVTFKSFETFVGGFQQDTKRKEARAEATRFINETLRPEQIVSITETFTTTQKLCVTVWYRDA